MDAHERAAWRHCLRAGEAKERTASILGNTEAKTLCRYRQEYVGKRFKDEWGEWAKGFAIVSDKDLLFCRTRFFVGTEKQIGICRPYIAHHLASNSFNSDMSSLEYTMQH